MAATKPTKKEPRRAPARLPVARVPREAIAAPLRPWSGASAP